VPMSTPTVRARTVRMRRIMRFLPGSVDPDDAGEPAVSVDGLHVVDAVVHTG
jgi:hypothetical protein